MCGIVGFIGKNPENVIIEKLKLLEYRGYDSAGIAVKSAKDIKVFKAKGEIKNLEQTLTLSDNTCVGIGHTRWATHGVPDKINAHPHLSKNGEWVIVHNGIIENYAEIKKELLSNGYEFISQTDTEVVAHLLHFLSDNSSEVETVYKACKRLKGSYALAIINKKSDKLYFAKNKSPLFIAKSNDSVMLASDVICFKDFCEEYYPVSDGVYGYADVDTVEFFKEQKKIPLHTEKLQIINNNSENKFNHYMIKEINETHLAIKNLTEYYGESRNRKKLDEIDFNKIDKIKLVGCGTAYHAALIGAKMIENACGIECCAYVASEFRYSMPKITKNTIVIFISQSGETADTIAALELVKETGATTIAVINVEYSRMGKLADVVFPIKAGVEMRWHLPKLTVHNFAFYI